jgi:hypothetical protein
MQYFKDGIKHDTAIFAVGSMSDMINQRAKKNQRGREREEQQSSSILG